MCKTIIKWRMLGYVHTCTSQKGGVQLCNLVNFGHKHAPVLLVEVDAQLRTMDSADSSPGTNSMPLCIHRVFLRGEWPIHACTHDSVPLAFT